MSFPVAVQAAPLGRSFSLLATLGKRRFSSEGSDCQAEIRFSKCPVPRPSAAPEPLLQAGTCDGSPSRGKTQDPPSHHSTSHPGLHTAPALRMNSTELPRTVSPSRIILLPACVHGEEGAAGPAASPPHRSTQDHSPRRILSLLDNLHVASLLHILSCSSDMVPVSTHGIQAFKIFHKLRQLYISTLWMISKPPGSAQRAFHKISSWVMVALRGAE